MKLSKAEYEELIRKKPSLRPTEETKCSSPKGYKSILSAPEKKYMDAMLAVPFTSGSTILSGPHEVGEPNGVRVTIIPEKPVKSPRTLKFTIPGQPVGKPRQTRSDKWRKRPCVMRYRAWADKARASVPTGVSLGVYRQISFIAYLEFPKSYSTTKRAWLTGQPHMQKPDGDNVLKAILDALFDEDKLIWKFSGEKRWDDGKGSRIEVELR